MVSMSMNLSLGDSYRHCEDLARRTAGNFYPAFRVLPREQRLAMCALYAFMRITDDLADEPDPLDNKRRKLAAWRQWLHRALAGEFHHSSHPALADTVHKYRIPVQYLEDVIDGVEMDLDPIRFATWPELERYCYRVASAVGLCCIHIWGFRNEAAVPLAVQAGHAFQLTNILRDLKEDAAGGRIYLPTEDLDRFGYTEAMLRGGTRNEAFRELMRFEIARARSLYETAWPIVPLLDRPGRAVFLAMARTYRGLLDIMERRDFDVFSQRVSVPKWKKAWNVVRSLPVRFFG